MHLINDHNQKGQLAENIALKYLQAQGLKKIQSNFSCKSGEIDLIMHDNEFLVFIEVRYRRQTRFGHPLETINYAKQKKIIKTIQYFLMKNPAYHQYPCRIDAVALHSQSQTEQNSLNDKKENSGSVKIEWVKNAIQAI